MSREHSMQGWAMIKDRNSKDLTEAEEINESCCEYTEPYEKMS